MTTTPDPVSPSTPSTAAADLAFVAAAIRRREVDVTPLPIALFWALYTVVGFTLIDFLPQYCGLWFGPAGIFGWIFSYWMGFRYAKSGGVISNTDGQRQMLHWGSILLGIFAAIGIVRGSNLPILIASQITVLTVGLIYFLAGVHFDRRYLPLGLILVIGSVITGFVDKYAWTGLGVLVAVGLVLLAIIPRKVVRLPA